MFFGHFQSITHIPDSDTPILPPTLKHYESRHDENELWHRSDLYLTIQNIDAVDTSGRSLSNARTAYVMGRMLPTEKGNTYPGIRKGDNNVV